MGLGGCIILIAVGAILTFATDWEMDGVNLDLVGCIIMIVGLIGVVAFISIARRRRMVVPPSHHGRRATPQSALPRPCDGYRPTRVRRVGPAARPRAVRRQACSSMPARTSGEPGRPVGGDADGDAPVLLVHMAGRVLVRRVVVAGRRHRGDVQHALGDPVGEHQVAAQVRARARARRPAARAGWRRPAAGSRARSGCRASGRPAPGRPRPAGACPAATSVAARWVRWATAVDPYRLLGQPQPGQPVPGGLDDHDVVADQHRVADGSRRSVASVVTSPVAGS